MILTLSCEYVRNTVLMDEHGLPVFESNTPFRVGARKTTITQAIMQKGGEGGTDGSTEAIVGTIEWDFQWFDSSKFTIGGTEIESNVFLPSRGILGRTHTFTGPDGCSYKWVMYMTEVALWLDDRSETEVARYHRATLGINGKRKSAFLEVAPQAEHILDFVIFTFIYVEKLRMDRERRRQDATGGGP